MAADIDVYQSCPCGSGKKLKFCCHAIAADMAKIADMQAHHQYQMAVTALEGLKKKNLPEVWSRAWVNTTLALIHSRTSRHDEARQLIDEVLDDLPEHPLASAMHGILTLADQGYPAAQGAIYDAFQVGAGRNVALTAHLARILGLMLANQGHFLAARENLAFAVQLNPEDQQSVDAFVEFEQSATIPYPLRSRNRLLPFAGDPALKADYDHALSLAGSACFSDAAKEFGKIARQNPQLPGAWWNIALCHAAAAEDPLACQAFKAAAANDPDPESAAEALLLWQLLKSPAESTRVERMGQKYRVHSVGKLLTLLDQQAHLVRGADAAEEEDEEGAEKSGEPTAWYEILDRDPQVVPPADLSPENIAHRLGQIQVFDAVAGSEQPPHAVVACIGRERLTELQRQFEEMAAGEVEAMGEPIVSGALRPEVVALLLPWYLPDDLSPVQSESLNRVRWTKIVDEIWPTVPQELLGGKTPLEAAAEPSMRPALIAAVLALDVLAEQSGHWLDQAAVRHRLGLGDVAPLEIPPEGSLEDFSLLQMRRLPPGRLSDEQLVAHTNYATKLGHSGLSGVLLRELVSRPTLSERAEAPRIYMALSALCRRRFQPGEALEFLIQGKQAAKARKEPLDTLVLWEVEELVLRSRDRSDPKLNELAATLWNYYRPKLPGSEALIANVLNEFELPGPWNQAAGALVGGDAALAGAGTASGGIWTPEAPSAAEPSKLWLPGQ